MKRRTIDGSAEDETSTLTGDSGLVEKMFGEAPQDGQGEKIDHPPSNPEEDSQQ